MSMNAMFVQVEDAEIARFEVDPDSVEARFANQTLPKITNHKSIYLDSAARLSTTHERINSDFAARSPVRFGNMMPFDLVTRTSSEFALPACTTRSTPS